MGGKHSVTNHHYSVFTHPAYKKSGERRHGKEKWAGWAKTIALNILTLGVGFIAMRTIQFKAAQAQMEEKLAFLPFLLKKPAKLSLHPLEAIELQQLVRQDNSTKRVRFNEDFRHPEQKCKPTIKGIPQENIEETNPDITPAGRLGFSPEKSQRLKAETHHRKALRRKKTAKSKPAIPIFSQTLKKAYRSNPNIRLEKNEEQFLNDCLEGALDQLDKSAPFTGETLHRLLLDEFSKRNSKEESLTETEFLSEFKHLKKSMDSQEVARLRKEIKQKKWKENETRLVRWNYIPKSAEGKFLVLIRKICQDKTFLNYLNSQMHP